jgi:DNA-binding LacI/PurR family transcriptional regulator
MPEKIKKPNIYDVAKLAGVSHQTVSRVINDGPHTRPSTRAKVELAMTELGYVPNAAARALVTSQSKMIGMVVADEIFFGPAGMIHALKNETRMADYFAVSCSVDGTSSESMVDGLKHLRRLGLDAIIVITPQFDNSETVREILPNIPALFIDSKSGKGQLSISLDNFAGSRSATEHMIGLGHKNIVHISGPTTWQDAEPRVRGYESAMISAGLTPNVIAADWLIETGYQIGLELDLDTTQITAIVAANDHLALGLMKAFHERQIAVPERVSIVGFDDIPEARFLDPALTTLRADFDQLGKLAVGLLLGSVSQSETVDNKTLYPELIIRNSTAAPTAFRQPK